MLHRKTLSDLRHMPRTLLLQLWAKQQDGPYTIHLFNHWFKDRFNKNGRILDAALRGFPVYLSECWFRIQVVCELGNTMTGNGGYDKKNQIQIQFSHSWEGTSCGEATCPAATWCSMPARQWMGFQVWASVPLIMWTFPACLHSDICLSLVSINSLKS